MAVPTPVMAKARIGHFAEAQVLRAPLRRHVDERGRLSAAPPAAPSGRSASAVRRRLAVPPGWVGPLGALRPPAPRPVFRAPGGGPSAGVSGLGSSPLASALCRVFWGLWPRPGSRRVVLSLSPVGGRTAQHGGNRTGPGPGRRRDEPEGEGSGPNPPEDTGGTTRGTHS